MSQVEAGTGLAGIESVEPITLSVTARHAPSDAARAGVKSEGSIKDSIKSEDVPQDDVAETETSSVRAQSETVKTWLQKSTATVDPIAVLALEEERDGLLSQKTKWELKLHEMHDMNERLVRDIGKLNSNEEKLVVAMEKLQNDNRLLQIEVANLRAMQKNPEAVASEMLRLKDEYTKNVHVVTQAFQKELQRVKDQRDYIAEQDAREFGKFQEQADREKEELRKTLTSANEQRVIALENKFENEYREKITTLEKELSYAKAELQDTKAFISDHRKTWLEIAKERDEALERMQELREAIVTSEQASGYWRMKCEKLRKSLAAAEGEAFAMQGARRNSDSETENDGFP